MVQPTLPAPYPKLPTVQTINTTTRLNNLVPGVHITVKVSAYQKSPEKSYYGRQSSIYIVLAGKAIPKVLDVSVFHDGNITRLRWKKPETDMKNLTYAVYYGTTMDEMNESKLCGNKFIFHPCQILKYEFVRNFSEPRVKTQETEVILSDLLPCHSYLMSVGIVGPKGPGPLTNEPITLTTDIKENAPPKTIKTNIDSKTSELFVAWEHR